MPRRIVDLSVALQNDVPADPPGYELSIDYISHKDTLGIWLARCPDLDTSRLPNGEAFALERLTLSSHNGTHVDAPWHYSSTACNGDRPAKIDELPLEWFFGNGVKLDFRAFDDGYVVTGADVEAELARIGHELRPFDIVPVRPKGLYIEGLRHGPGSNPLPYRARRSRRWDRRVVLGCSLQVHRRTLHGEW
jgi:kynurenine formamidase